MTLVGSRCILVHVQSTDIITASPSALAKVFWGRYFERTVRRSFHTVRVKGAAQLQPWRIGARDRRVEPLILYATHGSWWDAALTIVLSLRTFHLDAYGMMEYKQLQRYPFFRRIGMFSVIREDPASALRSIRYAASELRGTGRALWMFPQGTLVNQEVRPLELEPGLGILARALQPVWLCPVALRYDLVREQAPDAQIAIGTPQRWEGGSWSARDVQHSAAAALTSLADDVREDALQERLEAYEMLYRGRTSMEKRYDTFRGR